MSKPVSSADESADSADALMPRRQAPREAGGRFFEWSGSNGFSQAAPHKTNRPRQFPMDTRRSKVPHQEPQVSLVPPHRTLVRHAKIVSQFRRKFAEDGAARL